MGLKVQKYEKSNTSHKESKQKKTWWRKTQFIKKSPAGGNFGNLHLHLTIIFTAMATLTGKLNMLMGV